MNKTADDIIEISNVCLSVPYNSPSDDEIISAVTDYTGFSREIIRIIRGSPQTKLSIVLRIELKLSNINKSLRSKMIFS